MDADDLAAFKVATEKFRKRPALIHAADVSFFKDFLSTFTGIRLPQDLSNMDPIDLSEVEDGGGAEEPKHVAAASNGTNGSTRARGSRGGTGTAQAAIALEGDDAVPVGSPSPAVQAAPAPGAAPPAAFGAVDVADSEEEDGELLQEETQPPPELPPGIDLEPDPTPAQMAISAEARLQAERAVEAGDLDTAIAKYTEVILSGGATALIYTKRAELLLRKKRPLAAIRDCAVALEVNPEYGKAYRIRGIASRRLGRWEAAQKDFTQGQKLDFDESILEVEKFVAEKLRRLAGRRTAQATAPTTARKRQRRT